MQETQVCCLGQEDPVEKEMLTHSSVLAWEIPRTEEPGGLQSEGSQRVRHDLVTKQWHVSGSGRVFEATSTWKAFFYIHFTLD